MNFDLFLLINRSPAERARFVVFVSDHGLTQILNQAAAAVAKPLEVINA